MKDFIKRGESEKVSEKQGRISRGGGENIFWLARIYSPEFMFLIASIWLAIDYLPFYYLIYVIRPLIKTTWS